ncbi:MAG: 5-formyltetrahydrofolate cyclo-ligase [Clostridiales bacterium]|jgi:5-formyltetrahydrofolate cyclo-ligase|nr:5-formyltetrahydrofolate cyclo-ligase [Clostridiales bacterium]
MSANVKHTKVNIKEVKISLRSKFRNLRETMPSSKKKFWDASIRHNVFRLKEYKENSTLFIYVSKEIEVNTYPIIKDALSKGKRVAVPLCVKGTYQMEFYYITSVEDLEKGTFGVMEPITAHCEKVTDLTHGFCVVPGFSFDAKGYRLGYGKGYYDRFLSAFQGFTAGICYANCIQWNLPHGYYDRPVDAIVTENYIRRTAR